MKILLLLPLLLGLMSPAIAHNEFNGGDISHCGEKPCPKAEEAEGADLTVTPGEKICQGPGGTLVQCPK